MKTIGIKLADGSFYPVLEEGTQEEKQLDLTTAHNNQTRVMVDMYRSENCSIEDAEYVDTLQIDNLNAHPNGEPDISFTVSLDKDNNLFAKIVDSETGAQSKTTITLISRTAEERIVPDSYKIQENKTSAATGAGLLAAAMSINAMQQEKEKTEDLDTSTDNNDIFGSDETINAENNDVFATDDLDATADNNDIFATDDLDSTTNNNDVFATDDLDSTADNNDVFATNDLDSPSDNDIFATDDLDTSTDDNDIFGSEETITADNNDVFATDDLDSTDNSDVFATDDLDSTTDNNDVFATDDLDSTADNNDVFATDDLDAATNDSDVFATNDLDTATDNNDVFATNDLDSPSDNDIFATDDLDTSTDNNDIFGSDADDDWNSIGTEKAQTGNQGISFTGLYDKETALGQSAEQSDGQKNKTKIPVIICIVCAIICVLATVLVLLVIPSKYNLLKKNAQANTNAAAIEKEAEEPVQKKTPVPETAAVPEPEPVPVAVEDEIIVIEEAEKVVPELPPEPKPEKAPAPKVITYKIKWGDTLWDIADAYYKNPWKYKFIARYNGIKNPDQIISGTVLYLPEN